jgi:hypothetical protein
MRPVSSFCLLALAVVFLAACGEGGGGSSGGGSDPPAPAVNTPAPAAVIPAAGAPGPAGPLAGDFQTFSDPSGSTPPDPTNPTDPTDSTDPAGGIDPLSGDEPLPPTDPPTDPGTLTGTGPTGGNPVNPLGVTAPNNGSTDGTVDTASTPEPLSLGLSFLGLGALGWRLSSRRRRA